MCGPAEFSMSARLSQDFLYWLQKAAPATKSVPAPRSDPNTECSQFPAVLTLVVFEDDSTT